MTTIAYRDGVMVADSRGYAGTAAPIGIKRKIHRLENGTLIGISCSVSGGSQEVLDWLMGGQVGEISEKTKARFTALVVHPGGEVEMFIDNDHSTGPLTAGYYAIGTGAEYAMGAMAAGCEAHDAVLIAISLDIWSARPLYMATKDIDPARVEEGR